MEPSVYEATASCLVKRQQSTIAGWNEQRCDAKHRQNVQDAQNELAFLNAQVAQSVEQRTENPRVGGSIPPLGTIISLEFPVLS